jgi:hypothetical protein
MTIGRCVAAVVVFSGFLMLSCGPGADVGAGSELGTNSSADTQYFVGSVDFLSIGPQSEIVQYQASRAVPNEVSFWINNIHSLFPNQPEWEQMQVQAWVQNPPLPAGSCSGHDTVFTAYITPDQARTLYNNFWSSNPTNYNFQFICNRSTGELTSVLLSSFPVDGVTAPGATHIGEYCAAPYAPGFIGTMGLYRRPGTSDPLISSCSLFEVTDAFQSSTTGTLMVDGPEGLSDTGHAMWPGTSPSVAALDGGIIEVAYQAAGNGELSTLGHGHLGLGMMRGTSPALMAIPGGFDIAFQANTGELWTYQHGRFALGMMDWTSPSIAQTPNGTTVVAFQANTGHLWTTDHFDFGGWGQMASGTSPSISAVTTTVLGDPAPSYTYLVAFASALTPGQIGVADSNGIISFVSGQISVGTSPSIAHGQDGRYVVAYNNTNGHLGLTGDGQPGDTGLAIRAGTSPYVVRNLGFANVYTVEFQGPDGSLWRTQTISGGGTTTAEWVREHVFHMQLHLAANTSPSCY